jgi:hypothetical protein
MLRRAAAIVLALALNPALVRAQDTVLTVNVASADVYKGPSTVNPIVGHAPRGTVLPVSRNLGSWVKVAWPNAPDGVGYVHVTMGQITPANANAPAAKMSPRASSAAAPATKTMPPPTRMPAAEHVAPRAQPNVTPASHMFGVGGLVGSMSSFGATARAWRDNHLGFQVGLSRDAMTSDVAADRVTSMQFEPAVVYAPFDRVSDYVWIRPYVGAGLSVRHQTLKVDVPGVDSPSDNGVGFRLFGGGELTFASLPRFGLSVDLGYRRLPTPFPGFDADPLNVSIAGHWYIK